MRRLPREMPWERRLDSLAYRAARASSRSVTWAPAGEPAGTVVNTSASTGAVILTSRPRRRMWFIT